MATKALTLRNTLAVPITVSDAFAVLFRYIASEPGASFGWLPLAGGANAICGAEFHVRLAATRWVLRLAVESGKPVLRLAELLEIESTLVRIAATNRIEPDDSQSLVIALRVLDDAYRGLHPGEVGDRRDSLALARMRAALRSGKPLIEAVDFLVFPKPRRTLVPDRRGQGVVGDLLEHLAVVRRNPVLEIQYKVAFPARAPGAAGFRRIGVVPTIAAQDELQWSKKGASHYSVLERTDAIGRVHLRVRYALNELLDRGADVILMPELVSGDELHALVVEILRERTRSGAQCPALVLAGTRLVEDGGLSRNRAYILDGEGEYLWHQDKMHAFEFKQTEQESAGFPLGRDDLQNRLEAIAVEPRKLMAVDISASQRIVVLTCEDFIQDELHRAPIVDFGVTTLLVPIMAGSRPVPAGADRPDPGWVQEGAMRYVRHPGATSIVANSGTLITEHETEWWSYVELFASPRVACSWEPLTAPGEARPIAWLGEIA